MTQPSVSSFAVLRKRGSTVAIIIALLAAVYTHQWSGVDKVDVVADETISFLQTFHQVNTRSHHEAAQNRHQTEASLASEPQAEPKAEPPASHTPVIGEKAVLAAQLHQDCIVWMPIDLRILRHGLRFGGFSFPEEKCDPQDPMYGLMDFMLAQVPSMAERFALADVDDTYYLILPVGYVVLMLFVIGRMLWCIVRPQKSKQLNPSMGGRRPEAESWERGYMHWLFVDWVDDWIAKWGNVEDSDTTKISSEDLDEMGDPEDEVNVSFEKLKIIWDEEVDSVGLQKASILMVMSRFIGMYRLSAIVLWSLFNEICMFLGPPISMAWVIRYIEWLYIARLRGEAILYKSLVPATLVTILLFQGLPLFIAISNSISTMMGMRITIRVVGGLSSLIFKKAQRLPLCSLDTGDEKDVEKKEAAQVQNSRGSSGRESPAVLDSDLADKVVAEQQCEDLSTEVAGEDQSRELTHEEKICKRSGHLFPEGHDKCAVCGIPKPGTDEEEEADLVYAEDGGFKQLTKFNLVQVVANDVNTNVVNIPLALCRLMVMVPICMVLFGMLWERTHTLTVLCCMFSCGFVAYWILMAGGSQVGWLAAFYFYSGKRLVFLEDMLFNIRTVKAFGWEGIMEKRICALRNTELEVLWGFYKRLGLFFGLFYQFPRVMILISLWGYTWFYGAEKPVNIFATLPLLFTFQAAIMVIMQTAPSLLSAIPSIGRLEQFMKLPEAPLPRNSRNGADEIPAWVNIQPEKSLGAGGLALQIQGSFQWNGQLAPSLKDLNLGIASGTSIAILGKVGSGKSSLLHAMIGELYPVNDARITIPNKVAYSGQSPYICEGTMKENILYGEPYNESRYNSCIFAAGLLPDIQVLPGGDEVPIGSRGISLSGGQRARVSLARAAYCASADVVLIDDPFAALDSRTARHILDEYVHGEILNGRTKVVVCQPDPERIMEFDQVVILHKGRVVVQGTPKEVMLTNPYKNLLNHHQKGALDTAVERTRQVASGNIQKQEKSRDKALALRDDEFENRPDWKAIRYFLNLGGYRYLFGCIFMFLVMMVFNLMMGVVLQDWSSDIALVRAGMLYPTPHPNVYLWPYLFWWASTIVAWILCWACGMQFTISLSTKSNDQMTKTILHAPVDRFFDKTPVGRIMNRMSTDLLNIDTSTFNNISSMIGVVWAILVPLVYLHVLMPAYFSCMCIPFYYCIFLMVRRFWNTMVPMRYLVHVSKSHVDVTLTEVDNSNAFVRACRKGECKFAEFQRCMSNSIKADVTTQTFLKRWLVNRLFLMMGFFVCGMVLICIWIPNTITIGGVGLCLANMFQMIIAIESDIDTTMKAQFQFISLKRLHDYTSLEQEAEFVKESDAPYSNYFVRVKRAKLGTLERQNKEGGIAIVRKRHGYDQLILEQADENMFTAPEGFKLLDLDNPDLDKCQEWHRLVAINGRRGTSGGRSARVNANIDAMVEELCNGVSADVSFQIQSGWLLSGAHVVIMDLVAGYGNIRQNVLKGISIDIQPRSKVGVVGTTGCGKSTLLLCLLRILEPKGGKILLNGVDTTTLGLETLRTTIGMVAQDPVLMACSLRDNLDPFGQYSDDTLWRGLDLVKMKDHITNLGGLDFQIQSDGLSFSYGQRQLLCMARVVIRQPALILLDEATSALDPATQQQVQHAVEKHFPDSSMIMIAHRLETIVNFDKIVVMDKGQVAEQGPPTQLREIKDGIFASMWAAKQTW